MPAIPALNTESIPAAAAMNPNFIKAGKLTKKGASTGRDRTRFYGLNKNGVLHYSQKEINVDSQQLVTPRGTRRGSTIANLKMMMAAPADDRATIKGYTSVTAEPAGKQWAVVIKVPNKTHRLFTTEEDAQEWLEALKPFCEKPPEQAERAEKNLATVNGMFEAWGMGKFSGEDKEAEFDKYFDSSLVLDASADTVNTSMYTEYRGKAGFLMWIDFLTGFEFAEFTQASVKGPDGNVLSNISNLPTLIETGRSSPVPMDDCIEWSFNHLGKIVKAQFFWGNPSAIDAIFTPAPNVKTVKAIVSAWGEGKFSGADKEDEFKKYFADDVIIDASVEMANTDIYDEYEGMAGFLQWIENLLQIDFPDFAPTIMAGTDENTVLMHMTYTPTVLATEKTGPKIEDMAEFTFNADGKCCTTKFFWGSPAALDALFKSDNNDLPELTGNLFKRGALNKAYKKRKFVLWEGTLSYFTVGERGTKKGEIYIDAGWSVAAVTDKSPGYSAGHPFEFLIQPPHGEGRVYKIKAGSVQEQKEWVGALKTTVDMLTERKLAGKKNSSTVEAMFTSWATGAFSGDQKEAEYQKYFTADAVTLAATEMKHTDIFKDYKGQDGFLEWIENLTQIDFPDFSPQISDGPGGTVLMHNTYTPTVKATGKTAPTTTDIVEWTFNAEGKCTSGKFYWGNPGALDEAFYMDPNVATVQAMFTSWATGAFSGDQKEAEYQKYFTADAVTLAATEMKHTDIFKDYKGQDGFLEWIENLTQIDFPDFSPQISAGSDGKVLMHNTYTPTVKATGKTAPTTTDMIEWTFNAEGKCTSGKFYWGNPGALDEAFYMDPNVATVQAMFTSWATGAFSGDQKEAEYQKYFTADAVTLAATEMKHTDIFKDYKGQDGFLEWIENLTQIDFPDFSPQISAGSDGKVLMHNTYTPTVKATGKTGLTTTDMIEWTFNAEGKCTSGKFYWGNPQMTDSLFSTGANLFALIDVADFDAWYAGFCAHLDSTTGTWGFELPGTQQDFMDTRFTTVLRGDKNPNRVLATMSCVDMEKLGGMLQDENFQKLTTTLGENPETKVIRTWSIPGQPAEGESPPPKSDFVAWMQVQDPDKWCEGFYQHSTSKTGTWGYEVPVTRSEFCDDARTEVFRGVDGKRNNASNMIGMVMYDVEIAKLGEALSDPNFIKLTDDLGEVRSTKTVAMAADLPPPPAAPSRVTPE